MYLRPESPFEYLKMEHLIKLGLQISKRRAFIKLSQDGIATIVSISDKTVRFIVKRKTYSRYNKLDKSSRYCWFRIGIAKQKNK